MTSDVADAALLAALRGARAEGRRLAALDRQALLDSPPEPEFDAVVAEAAARFGAPIALISLLDADRQWFEAPVGLEVEGNSRSVAFCDRTIRQPAVMVVPDATRDPRFEANPLVTGDPGIRFYAGAPVEAEDGQRIGTVCIIDRAPRPEFGPAEQAALTEFAARVTALIARRRAGNKG
jgi:GAF domain-containing protein